MCSAWGQTCKPCGKQNHSERVSQLKDDDKQGTIQCFKDKETAMDALVVHLIFNPATKTYLEFFNTNPSKLLDMIEVLVMQKTNPIVHRISFLSIIQSNNESIQNYLIQLQSGKQDCNFKCSNCDHNLSSIYIKDKFIWAIAKKFI